MHALHVLAFVLKEKVCFERSTYLLKPHCLKFRTRAGHAGFALIELLMFRIMVASIVLVRILILLAACTLYFSQPEAAGSLNYSVAVCRSAL